MMIDTILLLFSILLLVGFAVYNWMRPGRLSKATIYIFLLVNLIITSFVLMHSGLAKIKSDIARIIHNTRRKSPDEIYKVLFKEPVDSCVSILNMKDQVIPKIDCCIWMELQLCPQELARITTLKNYQTSQYRNTDSLDFLKAFPDRPYWWTPQSLGDSIIKADIRFNETNRQTLFFSKDSSHVFLCDMAP